MQFLFATFLLLISALLFGKVFDRCKLPRVLGEIFGGFLLGPTVFGALSPGNYAGLFHAFPQEKHWFLFFEWLGLIFLMFISGFEAQKTLDRSDAKLIGAVVAGSTFIPFAAGFAFPVFFGMENFLGIKNNIFAVQIIVGVSVAVSAIPVISKIFIDLNIIQTRFAKIVIAAAVIHDLLLWLFMSLALALVSKDLFVLSDMVGMVVFLAAFFVGIVLGLMPGVVVSLIKEKIKKISLWFFVPLYFAIIGSKIDLVRDFDGGIFAGYFLYASFFAIAGIYLATRWRVRSWLSSFNLGVAMNARGAVGVALAASALNLGIINEKFFVTLVLVAVVSTFFAGYWFRQVLSKGWDLIKIKP
jgi:Kef-type K+ transport system membrane component KefB